MFLFLLVFEWVISAQGGLARYINHSCDPNCYTRITEVAGRKHIVINAKRRIEAGEELCYDYKVRHSAAQYQRACLVSG